jgi:hypothetical protein
MPLKGENTRELTQRNVRDRKNQILSSSKKILLTINRIGMAFLFGLLLAACSDDSGVTESDPHEVNTIII